MTNLVIFLARPLPFWALVWPAGRTRVWRRQSLCWPDPWRCRSRRSRRRRSSRPRKNIAGKEHSGFSEKFPRDRRLLLWGTHYANQHPQRAGLRGYMSYAFQTKYLEQTLHGVELGSRLIWTTDGSEMSHRISLLRMECDHQHMSF